MRISDWSSDVCSSDLQPEMYKALRVDGRPSVFEPLTLFSALSQHTSRIGFVATAVTSFDQPYFVARRFASLDHLSGGRAGWNIVTGPYAADALNFKRDAPGGKELDRKRLVTGKRGSVRE